ncbi:MAG: GspH/FimT family pseudopilin [Gammaproteobacteria bacterium]|jgi:type IV fimbrial biogenesis protein FimT
MINLLNQKFTRNRSQSGFTLIELMLAVTIVGILAAAALPGMNFALDNSKVRTVSTEIHTSLLLSRSEAIKRNSNITLNRTGATWLSGWTVQTGTTVLPNGQLDAFSSSTVECWTNTGGSVACGNTLTFERSGRPSSYIEFRVYNSSNLNIPMRCVKVSLSGRPGVTLDTNTDPTDGCN